MFMHIKHHNPYKAKIGVYMLKTAFPNQEGLESGTLRMAVRAKSLRYPTASLKVTESAIRLA
jgi:hypothetical protein